MRHAIWTSAGAVHAGGLVQLGGDGLERREQDEHVVARVLPGADVRQQRQDRGLGQELRRLEVEGPRDLRHGAERLAVQVAPDERRDDTRHRERQEQQQPVDGLPPDEAAVEDERRDEGEAQHQRHLEQPEREHVADAVPEHGVREHADVVVDAHEGPAAHEAAAVGAQVERPQQGQHHEHHEHDQERGEEQPRRGAPPPPGPPVTGRRVASPMAPRDRRSRSPVAPGPSCTLLSCDPGRMRVEAPDRGPRRPCVPERSGCQGATTVKPWSVAYCVTFAWRSAMVATRVLLPPATWVRSSA